MKIITYIIHKGNFIPIEECQGLVEDQDYIEGAIDISIKNRSILSKEHYDYVDQLWSYFLDGILSIKAGNSFSTFLPDSPIQVSFDILNEELVKLTVIDNIEQSEIIDKDEFVNAMINGISHFIKYLPKIAPETEEWSKNIHQRVEKIGQ